MTELANTIRVINALLAFSYLPLLYFHMQLFAQKGFNSTAVGLSVVCMGIIFGSYRNLNTPFKPAIVFILVGLTICVVSSFSRQYKYRRTLRRGAERD